MSRLWRLLALPYRAAFARIDPTGYARSIGVRIGKDSRVYGSSYSAFGSEPYLVSLGDRVFVSADVRFITHDGSTLPWRDLYPDLELAGPIRVGDRTFIGCRATIMPGVTIGPECIIGACAVVTKDIPAGSIAVGNPARVIRRTADWLNDARARSLGFGHLTGGAKVLAYRGRFS